jgi:uncharacterized protein with HEPN domain
MSPDEALLIDIIEAIKRALRFAQNIKFAAFLDDQEPRWAVYSQIIIIGEAATKLTPEFQHAHVHIPWKQMAGMRHRLIHGYAAINWVRVWETVDQDLPELLTALEALLPAENN